MRSRRADGRTNAWWYGAGDVQPNQRFDYTTENLTTTEDASECTDGQTHPYKSYHSCQTYRIPRAYGPRQYYYPVRRSRHRAPFTVPYVPYEIPNPAPIRPISPHQVAQNLVPQYRISPYQVAHGRRLSRSSVLDAPKQKSAYHLAAIHGGSPQQHPLIRRKHKMLVYSGRVANEVEDTEFRPKVYWRKTKKIPSRKIIRYSREAVESETSNDGKSIKSSYSKLSVDVTSEMEAMNRDIETILSRYESAFDQNVMQELEDRGLGKKKLVKQESSRKTGQSPPEKRSPRPLSEQQKKILTMDKPPLGCLADIPVEYLQPRSPSAQNESHRKPKNPPTNTKDAVWKTMLEDLLNRGVLNNLDGPSLTKFQSTLDEVKAEASNMDRPSEGNCLYRRETRGESSKKKDRSSFSEKRTTSPREYEYLTTSSGARIPVLRTPAEPTGLTVQMGHSEDFLPIDKVDDDSNWRKTMNEIREEIQPHCPQCKTLTDQLNDLRRGWSGDKLFTEDKSVNTEKPPNTSLTVDLASLSSKSRSYGDQKSLPKSVLTACRQDNNSLSACARNGMPETTSNITINTALTGRTKPTDSQTSVNTGNTTEEPSTNDSSASELKAGIGVAVEDVGSEEDLPIQRKLESTSLSRTNNTAPTPNKRRPNTPTTHSSTAKGKTPENNKSSTERRDSDVTQGSGDTRTSQVEKNFQRIATLVEDIRCGKTKSTADVNKNLAELDSIVTENAVLLDTDKCLSIMRKLLDIMLASEPNMEGGYIADREKDSLSRLLRIRKDHMQLIKSELNRIDQFEKDSLIKMRVKSYYLPPPTSGTNR